MEKKVIILTKSNKNGGYCVAGIDVNTGEFIRLVSEDNDSHYALSNSDLIYDDEKTYVEPMDIVIVQLKGKQNSWYQPENYIINDEYYFLKVGTASENEVQNYLMNQKYIFYNSQNYIESRELRKQLEKYSLVLFRVDELKMWRDKFKDRRITASFIYNDEEYRFIKITDQILTEKYYDKVVSCEPSPYTLYNPILIMSLAPQHIDGRHYKLIANIIEEDIIERLDEDDI